ncbi:hypothetical protein [Flavobacterium sp. XS2P14]|uniref:hypothetical protein n=1 Tax=Flavobacterium sp. XS2P14 TaxID=3401735 RepID=UPI003AB065AA
MKSSKILIVIFSLLVIRCCQEKKEGKKIVDKKKEDFKESKYFEEDRIKNNKYNVKYKGDEHSFSELELYYSYNDSRKEEILPYTLIIVEKYKRYNHCITAFNNLIEFYTGEKFQYDGTDKSLVKYLRNIKKLNQEQRNFLLYFLKLGATNNDIGSVTYLELLNREGVGIDKNLKKADSLKNVLIMLKKSKVVER